MVNNYELARGISLIIASYCGFDRLDRCFETILLQTISADLLEIIVVINGNDDGSIGLVEKLKSKFCNREIILLYTPVKGASFARNLGIKHARREFVVFLDDDDVISSNYLEVLLKYANLDSVTMCQLKNVKSIDIITSKATQSSNEFINFIFKVVVLMRVMTMNACKIIPTKYLHEFQFNTNLRSSEDMVLFSALYIARDIKLVVVPSFETACYYRLLRASSLSRQSTSYDFNIKQRLDVICGIFSGIDDYSRLINPIKLLFLFSRIVGEVLYSIRVFLVNLGRGFIGSRK